MDSLLRDLGYAIRLLARHRGWTATAVLTLGLGIGGSTAIFTVVRGALLEPLPYREPERLVTIFEQRRGQDFERAEASLPGYLDWKAQARSFEQLGGYSRRLFVLAGPAGGESVPGVRVTGSFFATLGVRAALGRTLDESDDRPGARTAVVTDAFWRESLSGAREAIGRTLPLNGTVYTVVGVLPPSFEFPLAGERRIWLPLEATGEMAERRNLHWLKVVGRLAPNVTLQQARREMSDLVAHLAQLHPSASASSAASLTELRDEIVGPVRPVLLLLLAAVGLVLLVACANVANLVSALALGRRKELAVRVALGASRARLVSQLLTESVLLGVLGGFAGVLLAQWALDAVLATIPAQVRAALPHGGSLRLDRGMLAFSGALAVGTGLLFGLLPALQASRAAAHENLQQEGRASHGSGRQRLRDALVVGEIALAFVLLASAALLGASLLRVLRTDPGFRADHLLALDVQLPPGPRYADPPRAQALYEGLLQRLRALPGVSAAGYTDLLPLSGEGNTLYFVRTDLAPVAGALPNEAHGRDVSPGYFEAMGIRIIDGRAIDGRDGPGSLPVTVINETLAARVFPGERAVGKHIVPTYRPNLPPLEIVGVVRDVPMGAIDAAPIMTLYSAAAQSSSNVISLVLRTAQDPAALATSARREVAAAERDLVILRVAPMEERISGAPFMFVRRFPALLMGSFAALAVLLALVGLYGVISFSVGLRTHELGVRRAVGAQQRDILGLVLSDGARLAALGLGLGLAGSLAASRLLRGLLFGVSATDPATLLFVAAALAAVALAASWLPAWRASRVSPLEALR